MSEPETSRRRRYNIRECPARTTGGSSAPTGPAPGASRTVPELPAETGLVVEDPASGFCGAVVAADIREVTLEDRHGRRRVFPLVPAGFLVEGVLDHAGAPGPRAPARAGPLGVRAR